MINDLKQLYSYKFKKFIKNKVYYKNEFFNIFIEFENEICISRRYIKACYSCN